MPSSPQSPGIYQTNRKALRIGFRLIILINDEIPFLCCDLYALFYRLKLTVKNAEMKTIKICLKLNFLKAFYKFLFVNPNPREQLVYSPPPLSLSITNIPYLSTLIFILLFQGQVRLRLFLGRALAARTGSRGPSAVARTDQGDERRGQDRLRGRALRP